MVTAQRLAEERKGSLVEIVCRTTAADLKTGIEIENVGDGLIVFDVALGAFELGMAGSDTTKIACQINGILGFTVLFFHAAIRLLTSRTIRMGAK